MFDNVEIKEYRGVEGLVAAEVLTDDNGADGYTTGTVFAIAGVSKIEKSKNQSSETHYYNNIPAIVIQSESSDTITVDASAIPLETQAKLTGQYYDEDTATFVEGEMQHKYWAIGYITKNNAGEEVYVWRYKCSAELQAEEHNTEDDSASANGQQIVFTGISTVHKFAKTGKGAKAINVNVAKNKADVSHFFDAVTTIDTLTPATTYTLTINAEVGTTITVKRNGVELASGATLWKNDMLQITGSAFLYVNGEPFMAGAYYQVDNANVVVTSNT